MNDFDLTPMNTVPCYKWEPKADITHRELGICLPIVDDMVLHGSPVEKWENVVNSMPENCKRHFVVINEPVISDPSLDKTDFGFNDKEVKI